jgi:hypothetical protein
MNLQLRSIKHRGILYVGRSIFMVRIKKCELQYCANFFDVGYSEKRLNGVFSVLL